MNELASPSVCNARMAIFVGWTGLALLVVTLSGCGKQTSGAVLVQGTVQVGGQPPPGQGILYFTPTEPAAGFSCRPATGSFDETGAFSAKSSSSTEGLMPGRYQVAVHCWKVSPSIGGPQPISYIDRKFAVGRTSGLELTIEPGQEDITDIKFNVSGAE